LIIFYLRNLPQFIITTTNIIIILLHPFCHNIFWSILHLFRWDQLRQFWYFHFGNGFLFLFTIIYPFYININTVHCQNLWYPGLNGGVTIIIWDGGAIEVGGGGNLDFYWGISTLLGEDCILILLLIPNFVLSLTLVVGNWWIPRKSGIEECYTDMMDFKNRLNSALNINVWKYALCWLKQTSDETVGNLLIYSSIFW